MAETEQAPALKPAPEPKLVKVKIDFAGHTHRGIAIPPGAEIEVTPAEADFINKIAAKRARKPKG
jgi:hypothetical protein